LYIEHAVKGQGTRCNTCSRELQTTRERGNVKTEN
jgi:hypothetical protein